MSTRRHPEHRPRSDQSPKRYLGKGITSSETKHMLISYLQGTWPKRARRTVLTGRNLTRHIYPPERLRRLFDYDPLTGSLKWRLPFSMSRLFKEAGSVQQNGYRVVQLGGGGRLPAVGAHHIAFAIHHGVWVPEHLEIDHVNADRLDNRASNLEAVTHSENLRRGFAMKRQREEATNG